jgi:hypothetical protein
MVQADDNTFIDGSAAEQTDRQLDKRRPLPGRSMKKSATTMGLSGLLGDDPRTLLYMTRIEESDHVLLTT